MFLDFAFSLGNKIHRFVAFGLLMTAVTTVSAETLPMLASFLRTSPATVNPGDTLNFAVTYTNGSSPLDYVMVRFVDQSGQNRSATSNSSSSGLVMTGKVDSNWLNGTYTITEVLMHDVSGRTTYCRRDGTVSSSPSLAGAPTTHSVSLSTQDFQVTGAIPAYFSPALTAIKRTSASIISPGDTVNLKLTYTEGSSPVVSIIVYFLDSSGAERITVQNSPTSGGVATLTVAPTWLNGLYSINAISLLDASGRNTLYQQNGAVSVTPNLAGFPATHALNFASEQFRLTGGIDSIALPTLKTITRASAATIKKGDAVNYQFTYIEGSSLLQSAYVILENSSGTIRMVGTLSPVSGGMMTATPDASWAPGSYNVREVLLEDASGRKTILNRDGSVIVIPDLANAPKTHSFSFSGLNFQLAEQPTIETQPQDLQTMSGASFTVSVQATGSALQYQWYRGAAGATTNPIAGATSAALTTQVSSASSVWVRVSNIVGTVDSRTVAIGIAATPVNLAISTQPMSTSVIASADASFMIQAAGSGSLSYQWQRAVTGTSAWTNLSNGGSYGGVTSNTLMVILRPILWMVTVFVVW